MQAKWRGISQALLNKRLTTRVYSKFDEIHLMFDEQSASRHSLGGGTMQNYTYKITLTLFFFFPLPPSGGLAKLFANHMILLGDWRLWNQNNLICDFWPYG